MGCGPGSVNGGEGGIRTLDRGLRPYSGLANRRPQPLGDFSLTGSKQYNGTLFQLSSKQHLHHTTPRSVETYSCKNEYIPSYHPASAFISPSHPRFIT